jgi:hypothetical protein
MLFELLCVLTNAFHGRISARVATILTILVLELELVLEVRPNHTNYCFDSLLAPGNVLQQKYLETLFGGLIASAISASS